VEVFTGAGIENKTSGISTAYFDSKNQIMQHNTNNNLQWKR
jgi:hypothetical protein